MINNSKNRFEIKSGDKTMKAVVTTGNGGYDKLVYIDVPVPKIDSNEVLVKVLAAGMNNTEINTRLGWYSTKVTQSTNSLSTDSNEISEASEEGDGGWNDATPFPFIQGTDCCGEVVEVCSKEHEHLIGKRVLIRACIRHMGWDSIENIWMASDFDGAFAQYVKIQASEVFPVDCDWSDAELGSIPCSYGTSENMVHRAKVKKGDRVLVAGASGGVGSAVVQLAKRRGAYVIGIAEGKEKIDQVKSYGADEVIAFGVDALAELGEKSVDVVVDNVAGPNFPQMMKILKRGGRFVSSGAIAGPIVELDMRDFYLKDLSLIGCTGWDEPVFPSLISAIENGEIKPALAKTFPLECIVDAQKEFCLRKHVGKFVLIPNHSHVSSVADTKKKESVCAN
ncbi:MAG: alcohol dehydrogenase family protein [Shewanella sp.]|uniref:alcohol dehydrogenase family protein n=1 Tax=Shewanella sp. TaxID=50422 RepID=UPI003F34E173